MKIGVAGLWHLGVMYAAGFAELGHLVTGYDPDSDSISGLKNGDLLVFEPQLREMLLANLKTGNLKFTNEESDLGEVEAVVAAAQEVAPGMPIIATLSFDTNLRTMMCVKPGMAVKHLAALGVRII